MEKLNQFLSNVQATDMIVLAVILAIVWTIYELVTAPTDHNGDYE